MVIEKFVLLSIMLCASCNSSDASREGSDWAAEPRIKIF
jgi:hypothetical protein